MQETGTPALTPVNGRITVRHLAGQEFRVTAEGSWTTAYADIHFGELKATLAAARRGEGVRVLVDLRRAAVQTPATAERVRFWTEAIYRPDDRVAMVVASSVVKMQMRRVAIIATRELFLSEEAAMAWLRA